MIDNIIYYIAMIFGDIGADAQTMRTAFIAMLSSEVVTFLVMYVFRGIALSYMAKKRQLKIWYFAWIPFLAIYLIGKLAVSVKIFNYQVKRIGLIVMIVELVYFLCAAAYQYYFYAPLSFSILLGQLDSAQVITEYNAIYDYISSTKAAYAAMTGLSLLHLVLLLLQILLYFGIFRRYSPKQAFIFVLISMFVNFMFGVLLFIIRKRESVDYDAYVREQIRRMYGNNPRYGGTPNGGNSDGEKRSSDTPFSGFGGGSNGSENSSETGSGSTGKPFSEFDSKASDSSIYTGGNANKDNSDVSNKNSDKKDDNGGNDDDLFN